MMNFGSNQALLVRGMHYQLNWVLLESYNYFHLPILVALRQLSDIMSSRLLGSSYEAEVTSEQLEDEVAPLHEENSTSSSIS